MFYCIDEVNPYNDFYLCERHRSVFCVSHIHYMLEFIFVLDGNVTITINDKYLHLEKGNMAIIMPYEIHSFETPTYSDILVISFHPEYISEFNGIFSGKTFENPVCTMSKNIANKVSDLLTESKKDIFEIKSIIYESLSVFMKGSSLKDNIFADNDTLRRALVYILNHYTENISLQNVADKIGVTPVHLSRTISSVCSTHFTDIVNCLRLTEAKRLLEQTDMPISMVAYESGFGSIRNFNRLFEKYFNCSPKNIRNRYVKIKFLSENGVDLL